MNVIQICIFKPQGSAGKRLNKKEHLQKKLLLIAFVLIEFANCAILNSFILKLIEINLHVVKTGMPRYWGQLKVR